MPARRGAAPGASPRDRGAVAVEAAFAMLALVSTLLVLAWCLLVVVGQLGVDEAARAAARVAARGEADSAAVGEAQRLVHGADVEVRHDGDHVAVVVERRVDPPGALARWGAVRLRAQAVALEEQTP
jgi:hypothetical protein